jgi:hypothetical protein
MSKDSMILVKSTWNDKQTFRTVPVSNESPYVECIWDPEQKVFVAISKITKTSLHMLPKMDDNGDPTVCKTKRPNGRQFKEERKSIETFQEYYIEDMEAIDMILTTMCVNGSTFDYKSFMTEKA